MDIDEYILLILIAVGILAIVIVGILSISDITNTETPNTTVESSCEHEFVVTSEYDWFWESYRTYSKCHKCGKEV